MKDFDFEKVQPIVSEIVYAKRYLLFRRIVQTVAGLFFGIGLTVLYLLSDGQKILWEAVVIALLGFTVGYLVILVCISFAQFLFDDCGKEYVNVNTDYKTYYGFEYRKWYGLFGKPLCTNDWRGCDYLVTAKDIGKSILQIVDMRGKIFEIKNNQLIIKSA